MSYTAYLLLLYTPNPRASPDQTNQQGIDYIIQSTSVESALHSLSDCGVDGWTDERITELDKDLELIHHQPARQPPHILAQSKHHETKSRVKNAPELPVADQKSCKMLLDIVQLRAWGSGSSGRLRWRKGKE